MVWLWDVAEGGEFGVYRTRETGEVRKEMKGEERTGGKGRGDETKEERGRERAREEEWRGKEMK